MYVAVVGAIGRVVRDNVSIFPSTLEIILNDFAAQSFLTEHWSRVDAVDASEARQLPECSGSGPE